MSHLHEDEHRRPDPFGRPLPGLRDHRTEDNRALDGRRPRDLPMPRTRRHRVRSESPQSAGIAGWRLDRPARTAARLGSLTVGKGDRGGCGACAHHSGLSVTDVATPPGSSPVWRAFRMLPPGRLRSGPCVVADAGRGALVARATTSGVGSRPRIRCRSVRLFPCGFGVPAIFMARGPGRRRSGGRNAWAFDCVLRGHQPPWGTAAASDRHEVGPPLGPAGPARKPR